MIKKLGILAAVLCTFTMLAIAQDKPPMYSYVGNWNIPRAQWAEMEKSNAADLPILQKALASGTLIGYGDDENLVHQGDGFTHDDWWSAMSMAGLLNTLDQFYKSGNSTTGVLTSSTKHEDAVYVSRCYNWKPGTYKGVYTRVATYKLKADAPDDSVEIISKEMVAPMMEKLLADGTLVEYEVDTQAIHTESPNMFSIIYISANAEGLDKVNAALAQAMKSNPMRGPAFSAMVDFTAHRDNLARTNATYK
jgi:hypothetical protein